MLEENVVSSNWPRPGKSNRSVAMPWEASRFEIRDAAGANRLHVKQWANRAYASGSPSGVSRVPVMVEPLWLGTMTLTDRTRGDIGWGSPSADRDQGWRPGRADRVTAGPDDGRVLVTGRGCRGGACRTPG